MQTAPWCYNLISLLGIGVICGLAWLLGCGKGRARWRTVIWSLGLQLLLGGLVFALPAGRGVLLWLNDVTVQVMNCAQAGIQFLFGPLAIGPGQTGPGGIKSVGFILGVQALPTVIFFMALAALLYQLGVMQRLVGLFARLFQRTLGVSGAESLGVASNIFVGVETGGMIRPYLGSFTKSELFTLLTASMSTVSSTVMGIYILTLNQTFPSIAGHLISASIISAPAAIAIAKLMEPETGEPVTMGRVVDIEGGRYEGGIMEAVTTGSMDGVKLLVGIVALLISFLGLVALADLILGGVAGWFGFNGLALKDIAGWLAAPLALVMGVPPADAVQVGRLLGERVFLTEVVSYVDLAKLLGQGGLVYSRSALVAAYALCGFAHVASVAIFVGGYGALAPKRLAELARLGPRALLAATLATALTGCVAGLFAWGGGGLLGLIK